MYRLLSLLICVILMPNLHGQSWFDVQTDLFDTGHSFSGTPVAVVDMNNDFLDDVVFLEQGVLLNIAYQQPGNARFQVDSLGRTDKDPQWSLVVFDVDRNGLRDIIIAGAYDNVKIYYQEADSFRLVKHPILDIYAQAMNGVDINGDGWTDLFLCNDIGYNQVWWNNQGVLIRDTTGMFTDLPEERNSGNYGSEWSDVDNDGDLDLYVAKCNANAASPTDLRRINRLYIQQEDGTFNEEAEIRGVASGAQSWTGHFTDLNNDGNEDLLITNHDQRAEVYHNDGNGFFQDRTNRSGTRIVGPVIQSLAIDFDLDQKKDILIGGIPHYLYEQREGDRFQDRTTDLGYYNLTSFASGDLNADNRPDIFGTVGMLINLPSPMRDRIMLNNLKSSEGHSVCLRGTESNPDGIGAKIEAFIDGEVQSKVVKSGESYGIQNSYQHIFCARTTDGMTIDSIVVRWPSGNVQRIENIGNASHSTFIEETDIFPMFAENGRIVDICTGDSVKVNLPMGADSLWVNGVRVVDDFFVKDAGYYAIKAYYQQKGYFDIPGFIVRIDPVPSGSIRRIAGDSIGCNGTTLTLAVDAEDIMEVTWTDGNMENPRVLNAPGEYTPVLKGKCQDVTMESIQLEWLEPRLIQTMGDSVRKGDTAHIFAKAVQGKVHWYLNELDSLPISDQDSLSVPQVLRDTTFYVAAVVESDFPTTIMGLDTIQTTELFHSHALNGTMIFEVHRPTTFVSTSVYATFPGRRSIILLDKNLEEYARKEVDLDSGWTKISLGVDLFPEGGPYRLTTDGRTNRVYLGTRSPQLASSNIDIRYPYTVRDLITIVTSQYGNGSYDYFYRWEVKPQDVTCESVREPVPVVLKVTTRLEETALAEVKLWPNPSSGQISVEYPSNAEIEVRWMDQWGRKISPRLTEQSTNGSTRVSKYYIEDEGTYYLRIGDQSWPVVIRK